MPIKTQKTNTDFYLTTAISYPNGKPHIGHLYEYLACDAIVRFRRLAGYNVYFLTGTDEHGLKMQQTADKLGISPVQLVEENRHYFKEMVRLFDGTHDDFICTTEDRHKKAVWDIWKKLKNNGDIYLGKYKGWYSVVDEAFFDESELKKNIDGTFCTPSGSSVEWVEEESYFFKLSAYQDKLLDWYRAHEDFILPKARYNEVVRFVETGLEDLSISRVSLSWGIPLEDDSLHSVYVWLDALTSYITAIGYPETSDNVFQQFWPADVHVVGKDILRFHTVYWPAFLMSANLPIPKSVFSHGFILNDGQKMSKSLGNIVDPFDLHKNYGSDTLRYFFLREVSFGHDGHYSHEAIMRRYNADLANDLGNFAQRSLSMVYKHCEAVIPSCKLDNEHDQIMLEQAYLLTEKVTFHMERFELHLALAAVWQVIAAANRYFDAQEPWKKQKTDKTRMQDILYVTTELLRVLAIVLQPFLPNASEKLLNFLQIPDSKRSYIHVNHEHSQLSGIKIEKPEPLFPRIEVS